MEQVSTGSAELTHTFARGQFIPVSCICAILATTGWNIQLQMFLHIMDVLLAKRGNIQIGLIGNKSCASVNGRREKKKKERASTEGRRERELHKSNFCSFSESYLQQWETETARGRE